MALKDVAEYIRDAITVTYKDNTIPVFTQKSITDMYIDVLYAACTWSSEEHDRIFSKTARAIRMRLFEKEECFDGDVSIERQEQSVPDKLIKLISTILEGDDFNGSLSTSLHKISTNITRLIRLNSRKRRRSKKIQNFRHSTKNELVLPILVGLKVKAKSGKSSLVDSLADEEMRIIFKQVLEIRRIISNQVLLEFQERGFVCPSQHIRPCIHHCCH